MNGNGHYQFFRQDSNRAHQQSYQASKRIASQNNISLCNGTAKKTGQAVQYVHTGRQLVPSNCVHRDSNVFCLNACVHTGQQRFLSISVCTEIAMCPVYKHAPRQQCVLSTSMCIQDSNVFCLSVCIETATCFV